MKYNTIDELNTGIENRIKRTVKHYYTDWKNIDRPYYMAEGAKGIKHFTLIARNCGTYLFTDEDLKRDNPKMIIEYYKTQDSTAKFYIIDLDKLTIKLEK